MTKELFTLEELPPGKLIVVKKLPSGRELAIILPNYESGWVPCIRALRDHGDANGMAEG
jgi:hypothetical protein